ncbi:CKS-domain-containing protein [Neoconidiobolus thromboides FSU 785]|nr:CKS-domain-containing protein [Neoconidiobolus thromboides FSU 785]
MEDYRNEDIDLSEANFLELQKISAKYRKDVKYSSSYYDDHYEYRHVTLPKNIAKYLPKETYLTSSTWKHFGIQQSLNWEHYLIYEREPHILLFRRVLK